MKALIQLVSLAGILLTIIPPILFFLGMISHASQNVWMLVGTVIWFISASAWLGRKEKNGEG